SRQPSSHAAVTILHADAEPPPIQLLQQPGSFVGRNPELLCHAISASPGTIAKGLPRQPLRFLHHPNQAREFLLILGDERETVVLQHLLDRIQVLIQAAEEKIPLLSRS